MNNDELKMLMYYLMSTTHTVNCESSEHYTGISLEGFRDVIKYIENGLNGGRMDSLDAYELLRGQFIGDYDDSDDDDECDNCEDLEEEIAELKDLFGEMIDYLLKHNLVAGEHFNTIFGDKSTGRIRRLRSFVEEVRKTKCTS